VPAALIARRTARSGFLLAHRNEYLARRNWLQICLMGSWDDRALEILPKVLAAHAQACVQVAPKKDCLTAGGRNLAETVGGEFDAVGD
jgi:hypothetical protein